MGTVAASFLFNTKFPMPGMSWAFNTYKMNEYINEKRVEVSSGTASLKR